MISWSCFKFFLSLQKEWVRFKCGGGGCVCNVITDNKKTQWSYLSGWKHLIISLYDLAQWYLGPLNNTIFYMYFLSVEDKVTSCFIFFNCYIIHMFWNGSFKVYNSMNVSIFIYLYNYQYDLISFHNHQRNPQHWQSLYYPSPILGIH